MPDCMNCTHWLRSDDPCVGLCRKLQHYTFQLEGDDCELFEFGTAREVLEPAEIPAPKMHLRGQELADGVVSLWKGLEE